MSRSESLRLFVAFDIPEDLRQAIGDRCRRIRRELPPARWVPTRNIHLTLLFLGQVEAADLQPLDRALGAAFASSEPFQLRLEGAGTFPPGRPARVAWIGFAESPPLGRVQEGVQQGAGRALDLQPEERPFHPHLTLARCRRPWPRQAVDRWCRVFDEGLSREFQITRGTLYRSRLEPSGARYEELASYPLAEAA